MLFREVGVPTANANLAKFIIRIDDEVIQTSLYTVIEGMDEEFIRRSLQEEPTKEVGDLYKVIYPGTLEPLYPNNYYFIAQDYPSYPNQSIQTFGLRDTDLNMRPTYGKETNEETDDYQNLMTFTQQLNALSGSELKAYLDQSVNIDTWIRTLAISYYLGNPDDYRSNANNYYLYFDFDDKLTYIPFDFDWSMGQHWSMANYSLGFDIYDWSDPYLPAPFVTKVLEIEEYQQLYEFYLKQFVDDQTFSNESFNSLFTTYKNIYGSEFYMNNDKTYYITTKISDVYTQLQIHQND
jgi:hypothetical protein